MASNCSDILAGGVFNKVFYNTTESFEANLLRYFEQETYEKYTKDYDAGLKIAIPIKGANIPIGADGKYTQKGFEELKNKIKNHEITSIKQQDQFQLISEVASPVIASAWLECKKLESGLAGTGLQGRLEVSDDKSVIVFKCAYIPTSLGDAPPTILNLQVIGASYDMNIFTVGSEVQYGGNTLLLRRSGNEAVTVALNTTKGNFSASVNGDVIPPPVPRLETLTIRTSSVGQLGVGVRFEAVTTGGMVDECLWDFGDGNSGTGIDITYTYQTAGSFTVWATVKNAVSTLSTSANIQIAYPPDWLLYGQNIRLQNGYSPNRWLTGARERGNEEVRTDDVTEESDHKRTTYTWTVMKEANNAGSGVVNYGETVFLKCNWVERNDRWLTGNRDRNNKDVLTRNVNDNDERHVFTTYQWTILSEANAPGSGQVRYGATVLLKCNGAGRADRWLTGARGDGNRGVRTDNVNAEDHLISTYQWAIVNPNPSVTIGLEVNEFALWLYVIQNDVLHRVNPADGQWEKLTESWSGPTSMAALDDHLYVIQNDVLHRVSPANGQWERLTEGWSGTTLMATLDDRLYVIQNDVLHRVDPATGQWERLTEGWSGTTSMAALGDRLYVIQSDVLYQVDPADGQWQELTKSWSGPTSMAALDDRLYVIQNDVLHRVNPATGQWERLTEGWSGTTSMAALGNHLYVIQNDVLHRVDPADGQWRALTESWSGPTSMTSFRP